MTTSSDPATRDGLASRAVPRLHVVTDDGVLADPAWQATATAVLEAGGRGMTLHVRGPGTAAARLHGLVHTLLPRAKRAGARVMVNDRADVALATGADGVQLPERSMPTAVVRELLGNDADIGVSIHPPFEGLPVGSVGADFLLVGTVFPTATHPGLPGMGLSGLRDAIRVAAGLPVVAIGGIAPEAVRDLLSAGAHGVAVLGGVWAAPSPADAVREYIEAIEGVFDE